jgi:hypothetical protein
MMKKLMTKENGILLGVGVVAFLGVRYMLNKRNETTSSASGRLSRKRPTTTAMAGKRCNCPDGKGGYNEIDWCRGGTCDQCCGVLNTYGDS